MKLLKWLPAGLFLAVFLCAGSAWSKADVAELYTSAVMTGDVEALDKLLAPNFWHIASNGHIRDKEHFLNDIRDKKFVVNRLTLTNMRESKVGDTRLRTSNGVFHGESVRPLPQGLMRFSMVIADNNGKEQIALFQVTPVMGTAECPDGNCQIR